MVDLNHMGKDYSLTELSVDDLDPNPIVTFEAWFKQATNHPVPEPNAACLASLGANEQVSSRMVLIKYFDDNGFVFFTNYESPKSEQLLAHPKASLCLWWQPLEQQLRIEGVVEKLDPKYSDAYFSKRSRGSQIGAYVSKQSQELKSRATFIDEFDKKSESLKGEKSIVRPDNWGGFILKPTRFEFWQGRALRLHDRFEYTKTTSQWIKKRLYP